MPHDNFGFKPDYADLYRRLNDWFQHDNYWEIADKYHIPPSKEFTLSVLSEFKKMFPTLPEQCEKDIMVRTSFISRSIAIAFDATPEEVADDDGAASGRNPRGAFRVQPLLRSRLHRPLSIIGIPITLPS